ncbi:TRAP transporter large permease [Alloalcanivorax profundimaris]|jgi:tripartite ATP-independent transporter DctM subunit|uniref:TRAP transporter large permease n=1 Tax=Alloalcanivorax profundimaris TaxID=2735259 RepID=UPI000C402ABA|nr:TRAP transporter large permease [Alloalcanivorax profundimaris]MBI55565.1 C4-dicarboxylate ABC transporter [Alcanivorax sp.]MBM1145554.1 TRAP transporter large permease [Alcanivorax sp. ZXX171]MCQ6263252.1 TRAP transporter large permease [Alcanivorax sp. MM125-6]UWN49175.1 Sialic acid TRAP transporter permease protein SiaT [Alcanivorax sp. ALC70]MBF1801076.1 TRAP transporter large permease [Alloalcanivorax profundimaris]|tara:strand:+ start:6147 stop:7454 length:1308 start_codon:yes stop_codon:yes gene_type:complete
MSDVGIGLTGLGILLALIALRVPIGMALIGVSFGGLWYLMGWNVAWGSLGLIPYQFSANWVLSSVPMFLLLGFICFHAQLTQGLFRAARLWLSGIPGGLAVASIFGSAGFAAVSGSSVACSAAMGRIAVPEMMRHGYRAELATGTVAVAGTIGALIPPSIIMILYGIIAQVPITGLFLGGISAGILTTIGYIVVVMVRVKLNPTLAPRVEEHVPTTEKVAALKETWPVLLIMVGIFGGLFGGIFTATEAGAVGAFLSCVVALFKRALSWQRFKSAILETLMTTGALLVIAVGASLLTRFLSLSGAGDYLASMVIGGDASTVTILIAIVLIYLLLGMFLEPIGAMLLTLPIVLPIIGAADLSLLWFGIILTKLLEIGMITPPIGMNVFVIKGVVGDLASTTSIFKGIFWFLVMDLFVLLFLMTVPEFILFLPNLFG